MSNKYIRHGATFNGDGTTSDLAASNGGVGAWNNINVFEGTAPAYGTAPAAGDAVYIRSKDDTGADITRTLAAAVSLGKAGLSVTSSSVTWVLDGGTVWSGINGVLTYTRSANYAVTLLAQNVFHAQTEDALVFKCQHVAANTGTWLSIQSGMSLNNAWIDTAAVTYSGLGPALLVMGNLVCSTFNNCRFSLGSSFFRILSGGGYGKTTFTNPRITMTTVNVTYSLFYIGSYNNALVIYGGSISGAGATTGQTVFSTLGQSGASGAETFGFEFPKTMTTMAQLTGAVDSDNYVKCIGSDSGLGAVRIQKYGTCDSRNDNNYPTLNATFPDSASTPWSWRIYPVNTSQAYMIELPFMKVFADTAAAKTVTLEVLIADSFEGAGKVNKGSLWFDVFYIDNTTGLKTYATSLDLTATANLDTSTAGWSATSWGAVACLKRKIAVTTPTAIKQNTMIVCLLRGWAKSASSGDVIFVDPDPQLT